MTITTASVIRLALLGLIGGLIQLSAVSQVTVFGVPADLTPLLVAFAGFIAGSITGAVFGFCLGLFIDVSLYQTLGVSSLVFTAVGYGAGRIRELRDPAHGLAPVAVGAAATAVAAIGFTLLQFLLGVQAPVSLLLLREILLTVVLNTLLALPVYALMRRALLPVPARGPAPPPAPGLHDRRAQPDLARLSAATSRRTRPADHAPAGVARRRARRHRVRAVRDRLLPALVPAGADGPGGASRQARDNRVRKVRIEAPRGDIVDRNNVKLVRTKAAAVVQMVPEPAARERARGRRRRTARTLAAAENDRLKAAGPATTRSGASCSDDGRKDTKAERRELRALQASRPATARPVAGADRAPGRDRADRALQAHGRGARGSRRRRSTSA